MSSSSATREVEHDVRVAAPARAVYDLIADVGAWPRLFPPTVHIEHLERGQNSERIQIWATANDSAKTWTSRRTLDPDGMRVDFRQEVSADPVGAMGGAWVVEATGTAECRVRLLHDYRAVDDDPEKLEWIDRAVDRNSRAELAALRTNAELAANGSELLLTFDDTVEIDGSAEDVYDFINEAGLWSQRLPHVSSVELTEDTPGLQVLAMDTKTKDGSIHTTKSVRVCLPHRTIVYKQTKLPALMNLHTGQWFFDARDGGGVVATSRHTVLINEDNIAGVLGADASVADARAFVRNALGTNSLTTLGYAKEYAEARAR
ncbi:aromatase/cyclase [Saccharomonospora saliphila]|uniref:aromatase/cyclase n=1 Tax=Saccharomonospora saliphila TaxID=369829 RepID=UPI00035C4161|nr:aromatase/cyclase [Saccharomonospora saliphila]